MYTYAQMGLTSWYVKWLSDVNLSSSSDIKSMHKQQNTRQSFWKETRDNDKFCHVQTIGSQTQGEECPCFSPKVVIDNTLRCIVVQLC